MLLLRIYRGPYQKKKKNEYIEGIFLKLGYQNNIN